MLFVEKIDRFAKSIGYGASIGFSDDDVKNVKHIENLMDNIHHEQFSSLEKFVVKGTKDPENITKSVRTFGEFKESMDPLSQSTISMRSDSAATGLDSKDPFVKRIASQAKVVSKITSDIKVRKKKKEK